MWRVNTRLKPDVSPVLGNSNSNPWTWPANYVVNCVANCLELDMLVVHCTMAGHKLDILAALAEPLILVPILRMAGVRSSRCG